MALSKIDVSNMLDETLPVAQGGTGVTSTPFPSNYSPNLNFRNIIINGDMSIAQRGTSQTSAGTGAGAYQVHDRFKLYNESQGAFTVSQSTDVPSGQGFAKSMKWDCTTADASPAAGDYLIIQQNNEGQNLQYLKKGTSSAESLTVSFWVKSNKTGNFVVELNDADNTRHIANLATINSSDTWEKKTITFAGDTSGAFNNDNDVSLGLNFWLGAGSTFSSGTLATSWASRSNANRAAGTFNLADSTSNEFYITGIQMEAGTAASDFEFLPLDINERRCFRYFQHHIKNANEAYTGGFRSATSVQVGVQMFEQMRGQPSATYQGLNCHDLADGQNLDASAISFGAVGGSFESAVWCIVTCASGGSAGDVSILYGKDTEGTGIIGFYMDAEI